MEPSKFRESRQAINRLCDNIIALIDLKDQETSTECHVEVCAKLEILTPLAEGEVQERSVKNLSVKLKALLMHIGKLKPKKVSKRGLPKEPFVPIEWDDARVKTLSPAFLKKVRRNMTQDEKAAVYFGTTGKGIRPSYEIKYEDSKMTAFSGSGHTPLAKLISAGKKKVSQPFSYELITAAVRGR
jgi:hypothetical protein